MKRTISSMSVFLLALAGCVDNIDSVTREYRATTNEAIDALTMIGKEEDARRMTVRILKPMSERYKNIDHKLVLVKANRDKPEFVKEVLESDSVQIYITDMIVNRQRFQAEIVRLQHVYKVYQDRERELLIEAGEADPKFDPREVCPSLHDLLYKDDVLGPLRKQLTKPDLGTLIDQFPSWKVTDYDKMWLKFSERRELFMPKREIKLAI